MKKYFWLVIGSFATIKTTCKAKRIAFMPTHFYASLGGGVGTGAAALVNSNKLSGESVFLSHLNSDNTAGDYLKPYLFEGRLSLGFLPLVYRLNQDMALVFGVEGSGYYKFSGKADLTGASGIIDKFSLVAGPMINLFYRYYRVGLSWDAFQYNNFDWKSGSSSQSADKITKAFGPGFTLSLGYEFMKSLEAMVYLKTSRLSDFGSNDISKFTSDTHLGHSLGIALKFHG